MRVLTYNIHGWATRGGPKARKPNLEAVAALLAAAKADIIGLNEVFYPRAVPPVLERPALEELARRLDMHLHFGPCVRWPAQNNLPADAYGNALLSRYPILAGAAHHLTPVAGKEPRGLLEARLLLPGGTPFTVYVTHLDHTDEQVRLIQLRALRTWTVRDRNRPHLVIGDFNAINLWDFRNNPQALERLADAPKGSHMAAMPRTDGETSEGSKDSRGPQVIAQMEKAGYIDVYTRFGAPGGQTIVASANPPVRIDYIFASRSLESSLRGCAIWMEPEGREASDHRPVYADLDIEQIDTGPQSSAAGAP